ncbi:MAG: hypothetical protein GEU74_13930 [Nitriliruptorales bacterium]|nr:hypothetical protein [Nitriliruptorales bacterium]
MPDVVEQPNDPLAGAVSRFDGDLVVQRRRHQRFSATLGARRSLQRGDPTLDKAAQLGVVLVVGLAQVSSSRSEHRPRDGALIVAVADHRPVLVDVAAGGLLPAAPGGTGTAAITTSPMYETTPSSSRTDSRLATEASSNSSGFWPCFHKRADHLVRLGDGHLVESLTHGEVEHVADPCVVECVEDTHGPGRTATS